MRESSSMNANVEQWRVRKPAVTSEGGVVAAQHGLAARAGAHDWGASPWSTLGSEPIPLLPSHEVAPWRYGVTGPKSAILAFTGMAASPGGLTFPGGGGHSAYGGNEVYRFSFDDMTWSRPVDPGGRPGDRCKTVLSDGSPSAVHSYDGVIHAPANDTVYRFGGVAYCDNLLESQDVFAVGPNGWQHLGLAPSELNIGISTKTAWNPNTQTILLAGRHHIAEFDPRTNSFRRVFGDLGFSGAGAMAYDPKRDRLLVVQMNGYWNLYDGVSGRLVASRSKRPAGGIAYSTVRDTFVGWTGGRDVFTVDPQTLEMTPYPIPDGLAPTRAQSGGVFGKWAYIAEQDLFVGYDNPAEGVWFFRLPAAAKADPRKRQLEAEGFQCADDVVGWECAQTDPQLIQGTVRKGVYQTGAVVRMARRVDFQDSVFTRAIKGKAAIIAQADTTLTNFKCTGIAIDSGNGACVRHERGDLTLDGVTGADIQSLVLSGPDAPALTLRDVTVSNVGGDCRIKCGRAHGVYYSAAEGTLKIEDSRFMRARDQGHLVKTGAKRTTITRSVLDEREGNGSRAIDAYNGGELVLRDVVIYANARDGNREIIGWNHEARTAFAVNRITFQNVTVHCDHGSRLIGSPPLRAPEVIGLDTIRWVNGRC